MCIRDILRSTENYRRGRMQRSYIFVHVCVCMCVSITCSSDSRVSHERHTLTVSAKHAIYEELSCTRASRFDSCYTTHVSIISSIAKSDGISCRVSQRNNKLPVPKTRRILIGNELKFFSRANDIIVLGQSFTRYFYIKRARYEEMFHDSTSKENVQHDPIENRVYILYYILSRKIIQCIFNYMQNIKH